MRNIRCLPAPLKTVFSALALVFGLIAFPHFAQADFRLCNTTSNRIGVALGYQDGKVWVTEGWWNVPAASCETLLTGTLMARYYYVYAMDYDKGGEWGGQAFMCTKEKEFTIRGVENCLARGFNKTGFFEVDTLEQRNWTVQLTDDTISGATTVKSPSEKEKPAAKENPAKEGKKNGE